MMWLTCGSIVASAFGTLRADNKRTHLVRMWYYFATSLHSTADNNNNRHVQIRRATAQLLRRKQIGIQQVIISIFCCRCFFSRSFLFLFCYSSWNEKCPTEKFNQSNAKPMTHNAVCVRRMHPHRSCRGFTSFSTSFCICVRLPVTFVRLRLKTMKS